MRQEDKELLLKDLCGRLYYKVKCKCLHDNIAIPSCIDVEDEGLENIYYPGNDEWERITNCKPYLRPMSSMTEKEFSKLKEYSGLIYDQIDLTSFQDEAYKCLDFYLSEVPADVVILVFDWLNAHHFDYRGLIERGLAIEAPEGMYK